MGQFYVPQELSERWSKTPEGYLLCEAVPIARTGEQLYACTEVPIEPTASGVIRIMREPQEVFRPETITSFEGKSVTLVHPDEPVGPNNWQALSRGVVQNVRRGTGIEDDYLFADLLVTEAEAIAAIEKAKGDGKPMQVSCGYDAEYEQLEPGVGRQLNIVGNHVALVERGRAGPRCAIKDEEIKMPTPAKAKTPAATWWDKAVAAVMKRDPGAMRAVMRDADGPGHEEPDGDEPNPVADELAELKKNMPGMIADSIAAAFKARDEALAEQKPTPVDDEVALAAEKAAKLDGGEVMTGDTLAALMSRVEILTPGVAVPTGDAVKTKGLPGRIMRAALVKATADSKTGPVIAPVTAGLDLTTATYDAIRPVFNAAVELARAANNSGGRSDAPRTTKDFGRRVTPAEMNAAAAAHWTKGR